MSASGASYDELEEAEALEADRSHHCCTKSCWKRAFAFGHLLLYLGLMAVSANIGKVLGRESVASFNEKAIFAAAFVCEWFVLLAPLTSTRLSKGILWRFWEKHSYWLEGWIYQNNDIWANEKGQLFHEAPRNRPGVFPSMSDNFATFAAYVLRPRPFLVIFFMMPLVMLLNMAQYGEVWVQNIGRSMHIPIPKVILDPTHVDLADVVFHPRNSCTYLHFVPIPYTYNLAKVVGLSFLQDAIFGARNLAGKRKEQRLSGFARAFAAFQILTVMNTWYRGLSRAAEEVFGETLWEQYEGTMYFINMSSSMSSLLVLTVKMFCEVNVTEKKGAPPGLGRLLSRDHWSLPGCRTDRERLFWIGVLLLGLGIVFPFATHIVPMTLVFVLGILFPLWGPLLPMLELVSHTRSAHSSSWGKTGGVLTDYLWMFAGVHRTAWQQAAIIGFMAVTGVFLRKWLWELNARFRQWRWERMSQDSDMEGSVGDYSLVDTASSKLMVGAAASNKESDDVSTDVEGGRACLCDASDLDSSSDCDSGSDSDGLSVESHAPPSSCWQPPRTEEEIEPQGCYGFNLSCYTVFFSLPLLAYCNSMICAGVAVYSQSRTIETVFMADFTSREIYPFNECLVSELVPIWDKISSVANLF